MVNNSLSFLFRLSVPGHLISLIKSMDDSDDESSSTKRQRLEFEVAPMTSWASCGMSCPCCGRAAIWSAAIFEIRCEGAPHCAFSVSLRNTGRTVHQVMQLIEAKRSKHQNCPRTKFYIQDFVGAEPKSLSAAAAVTRVLSEGVWPGRDQLEVRCELSFLVFTCDTCQICDVVL
jgi:hypothetical protein